MNSVSRQMSKGFALILSVFFLSTLTVTAQECNDAGKELFNTNCATCHYTSDKMSTGPGLAGVMDRVPSEEWLAKWIKNNVELIQNGDEYANKIYNQYGQKAMTVFTYLSDEDIANIIDYIKNPEACEVTEVTAGGGKDWSKPSYVSPGTEEGDSNVLTWVIVIAFLLVVITVFSGLNRQLKKAKAEREGRELPYDMSVVESIAHWAGNNKKWASILGLVITLFVVGFVLNEIYNIGVFGGASHPKGNVTGFKHVEKNYKPTQPIQFPHDLHAGKNEIDCQYCHSASRKSKTAGIPSVNVCMNCHNRVEEGARSGKEEIAKIYHAAGWDPSKMMYNHGTDAEPIWENTPRTDRPIEWVKVHNLADFVYFNHSQHVEVGKIECQTCHGPIETMGTAEQFAPLTMKWCIECHRETEINTEDNEYYDRIHKDAREAYKHQPIEEFKFTVEKIGGLECGKCHY